MNETKKFFNQLGSTSLNTKRLEELDKKSDPRSAYIIAMTPRSGSSYLCDLMKRTKRFGMPGEYINPNFLAGIYNKIPGRTPDEFLRNTFRAFATRNGVAGLKASWFQFLNFKSLVQEQALLIKPRYIYLTRRDTCAQAVSLYKATESNVFHTNIKHGGQALQKLDELEYSYERIDKWHKHILAQELGWQVFFLQNKIFPLCITYEDIVDDPEFVLKKIASYVAVSPKNVLLPEDESIFRKIGDRKNIEWSQHFRLEQFDGQT